MYRLIATGLMLCSTVTFNQAFAAVSFEYTYLDDASGSFASRGWLDNDSPFQRNIRAAADLWGSLFESDETIFVIVDAESFVARAGGTFTYGRRLGQDPAGRDIWEPGPLTRILTGSNPGETFFGFDIKLGFDAQFVNDFYWFDPAPETRDTLVPSNLGDFMTVVMHEFGHGFGIGGNRDFTGGPNHGQLDPTTISPFDSLSYFGGDGNLLNPAGDPNRMFFSGAATANVLGSDLPLTHVPQNNFRATQNFYHIGICADPPILTKSLMNGCTIPNGDRLEITPLDAAIYADMGYPMVVPEPPACDLNGNGACDINDIDLFWQQMEDLTGEGNVDQDDIDQLLLWTAQANGLQSSYLAGDTNLDGEVAFNDFLTLTTNFGKNGHWSAGDFDGNGKVEFADFLKQSTNFGKSATAVAVVPEPNAAMLLLVGLVGLVRMRSIVSKKVWQR